MAKGFSPKVVEQSVLFEEGVIEACVHVVDEADASEVHDAKAEHSKMQQQRSGVASSSSSSGAAGSNSAPQAKMTLTGSVTPAWAKTWMPTTRRYQIVLDVVRHFRWKILLLEKQDAPASVRKAFCDGSNITREAALRYCLRQTWQYHTSVTGEVCPWDLDHAVRLG